MKIVSINSTPTAADDAAAPVTSRCEKMEVNMTTDVTTTVEYLDALRKAAGRAIDPETAEVACWSAYTLDPYDDGRPKLACAD